MKKYRKAIVASGHSSVSEAAATILREGGNVFDAVVAAGFASTVAEQTLTSLGGGGLLLGYDAKENRKVFFDFFVDTPGLGRKIDEDKLDFYPVTVHFSGAPQNFNVGLGSVAVPGVLKGLLHVHDKLGKMNLSEVMLPAIQLARGHKVNSFQAEFLQLLYPIMTMTSTGRNLYGTGEKYIQEQDILVNSELSSFLTQVVEDKGDDFYRGDIAQATVKEMNEKGGLITIEDLASYSVIERSPLSIPYKGAQFYTAPFPSMGGTLIGLSLSLFGGCKPPETGWGSEEHLHQTLSIMREVENLRQGGITTPEQLDTFIREDLSGKLSQLRLFSRGTTHISLSDKEGNCASMTCSNGEGSGCFAPGTGIMLNNMMGEDDLHPEGFHSSPPGQRVGSMMSPSMLLEESSVKLVIGSGGSKRIRTAISQVLNQIIDFNRPLQESVNAPRMYLDDNLLQVEPGFNREALDSLDVPYNLWNDIDVYFGGVHAVIPGDSGAGDPRRGGSVAEIS